jgi:UDP-2,3-diacylglucosamine pyrophosphatase LpxH
VIVVVSDLHLTDGSGTTVEPGACTVFARLLGGMVRHASHRGPSFRLIDEGVDLVLLGDVLDLLRSAAWPARASAGDRPPRPWEAPGAVAATVAEVVEGILARNEEGLAVLRSLAAEGAVFHERSTLHRVPVRIWYFVGNHDWLLRLPGSEYEAIRRRVAAGLGLANDPAAPFPHEVAEAEDGLRTRIREHRLVLRHGDVHDPVNCPGDRNASGLGDAVVIELLNRFPDAVRAELGLEPEDPLYRTLREIENVRPFTVIPPWVLGVIRRFRLEGTARGRALLGVWNALAEQFFELPFVRAQDRSLRWDPVDKLQLEFRVVAAFASSRPQRWLAGQLLRFAPDRNVRYAHHALAEPEIVSGDAEHVVYGHTHAQEIRPLAARRVPAVAVPDPATSHDVPAAAGERVQRQYYFNCGTWRPTYRQTLGNPERLEFLSYHTLPVLAFYRGDERAGRGFEVWQGALATEG